MRHRIRAAIALAMVTGLALTGCGGGDSATGSAATLSIVGFAVPEAANKAIAAEWNKTEAGKGVRFRTSYGASGDQSRAVVSGLKADYVHFSVSSDVTRLVEAGLVEESWDDGPNKGIVSSSVVVLAVREGNPKNIQGWDDLIKPGIGIVTPNPASSGAARWNALAAWGHIAANGGTEAQAQEYLTRLFANVVSLPNSGRDATTTFLGGTGDVLLAYENETILARQNGEKLDWVLPATTILIQNPGAILKDADPKAKEWLDFVLGPQGQRQFARTGFRPIIDGVDTSGIEGAVDPSNPFPAPQKLLTVDNDFESWSALSEKFFDESDGIVSKVIAASGKAT
ncbi:sulfate transport system substrate-binding protein [Micromonospora phaseoli]|uniref:Sulfate transport system substrate-binding protein n=1 Tax=Micromonospora phaseoli TaxID=1144548 RepID=A0A1H6V199_9ACTN|nr:sulfate ABC transporter substrate-binding protein [Micromonospora phaseoli]PZV99090.1 sulfate transport system substrate-binding protein [Micromonospora phaseoli]GIJ78708.1 sulfate ABC transporter substrate-binding protein [Micromonospora phaseoli]SEI94035.1 sulfate transport system substrate-binding protein [Micromonospora phaseoli]